MPRAADVVKPEAYISLAPVPRGHTVEVAVVAHIRTGFHMNSNKPSEEYLIPTTLTANLPEGIRLLETSYPHGVMRKFKFSPKELSVYEGSATLRMKLQIAPGAPLGTARLPLTLGYQACNEEACLPPVKLPVSVDLEIAAAGAKAAPQHTEIFSSAPAKKQQ